jgi:hypothetical protein
MCNCNLSQLNSCKYSQRSNTAIDDSDKDLSNFLASTDYSIYFENFGITPLNGGKRLVTYNNTIVQALWLPTINESGRKQVLFTFYKLGTTQYLTYVAESSGELSNLLDMNGEWTLLTINKEVAITGFVQQECLEFTFL